ncbi:MAG: UDP-N-acetylmuramoyl-L-alanyl-D-glutamate--2,6-diaminopimelate ligase [Desulfobacula sp.]|nr:UDP-N-acetylmuramoyl-L-alanyl-D-glutamate--2,6-diaminopimelate ligase [Desulfobacula sp.]
MKLSDLIKDCEPVLPPSVESDPASELASELASNWTDTTNITSITSDSRQVNQGSLFIAVKGLAADGHDYIEQAFNNGAMAVVAQENMPTPNSDKKDKVIRVKNSRLVMAQIAANFYGHPSKDMTLIGITGTNGKTTTSFLVESILETAGFPTGVIGTVNIRYNGKTFDTPVTTPDSIDLQKTLHQMKNAGVTHAIMEVSSHGLDLNRIDFCHFDAGIFTNLTQDHLDYHKDMDDYFDCKKRFFTNFLGPRILRPDTKNNVPIAPAIVNIDNPYGKQLIDLLPYKTISISTQKKADLFAQDTKDDINGLSAHICKTDGGFNLKSDLTGTFNLENILCAVGVAHALKIDNALIQKGIENCHTVPGRLEKIKPALLSESAESKWDRFMFVDYAHTPDALDSILLTLKQRAPKRLITVFGCGGDRDKTKRPLMGQIACKHSDIAIVTSDNPRTENPDSIIDDIKTGLEKFNALSETDVILDPYVKGYLVEVDRQKALENAVFLSKPGDIIVAAGKGHETYQITNTGTIHFDDKEELIKAAQQFAEQFIPIPWPIKDLEKALQTKAVFTAKATNQIFTGISTDSRSIKQTQVFLALTGDTFDGHTFVIDLINCGIKAFVVNIFFWDNFSKQNQDAIKQKDLIFFICDNTLTALGRLGRYQRLRSNVKVLAITGSSGKTTTRKICEGIFKSRFHTHATCGNLNNEIGLPQTLLQLSRAHEWAIVEMGMNHPGEISRLAQIALPDIAMVLNTAYVHLEGLGSVENVAGAKSEIFEGVQKNGTAILPLDDPRFPILEACAKRNSNIKTHLSFGAKQGSTIHAEHINTDETSVEFRAQIDGILSQFSIHSPGVFMVDNCLAAILAARCAGISVKEITSGLNAFSPVPGRMEITKLNKYITLMDDTYNANPSSVAKALETLKTVSKGNNSIAVLGDMLELGDISDQLHRQIGKTVALNNVSHLFVFGIQVKHIITGALENGMKENQIFHGQKDEIAKKVLENAKIATWVLIKGSRGMTMEQVIQKLQTSQQSIFKGDK